MNKEEMHILIDEYIKEEKYQTRSLIMEHEDLFIDIFKTLDYKKKRKLLILNNDKLIALLSNEEFLKYLNGNENYKWDIYHIRNRLKHVDKELSKILIKKAEELLEHSSIMQHFLFIKENWKNKYSKYLENDYYQLPLLSSEYGDTVEFLVLAEKRKDINIWKLIESLSYMHILMVLDNIRISNAHEYKRDKKFKEKVLKLSRYADKISIKEGEGKQKQIPYVLDEHDPNILEINDFIDEKINFDIEGVTITRLAREINPDVYGEKICHSLDDMQIFKQEAFQRYILLTKQRKNLPIIKPKFMSKDNFEAYKMAIYGLRKWFALPSLEFLIWVVHSIAIKMKISLYDQKTNLKISERKLIETIISQLKIDKKDKEWLKKINSIVMSNNRMALNSRNNVAHYINTNIGISAVSIIYLGWWLLKFSVVSDSK